MFTHTGMGERALRSQPGGPSEPHSITIGLSPRHFTSPRVHLTVLRETVDGYEFVAEHQRPFAPDHDIADPAAGTPPPLPTEASTLERPSVEVKSFKAPP